MDHQLDHIVHGWALLAMRMPELRALSMHRGMIAEMCECYSLACLHLQKLKSGSPASEHIGEYEEIIAGIEMEARYYLTNSAQVSADGDLNAAEHHRQPWI
jgi:hypothetical protein